MFAAPGAEIAAARQGWGYTSARGTSFAAPFVAGLLADELREPDPQAASSALARLAARAIDLGERGRDPVYGFGLVGETERVSPSRMPAH
jgi:subtilisin family serine protease